MLISVNFLMVEFANGFSIFMMMEIGTILMTMVLKRYLNPINHLDQDIKIIFIQDNFPKLG